MSQFTRLTDRQTDGQADRILIARPRLHSMQRGKNLDTFFFRFVTMQKVLTERQTEGQTETEISSLDGVLHSMQRGKNGKQQKKSAVHRTVLVDITLLFLKTDHQFNTSV